MQRIAALSALLVVSACSQTATANGSGILGYFHRNRIEPVEAVAAEPVSDPVAEPDFTGIPDWRSVDPEDMLLIETRHGTIVIELNDTFAPAHSARMRQAARDGFYDGLSFYRVIDGFVAQGGRGEEPDSPQTPQYPALQGEFVIPSTGVTFTPMSDQDLYAATVGHVDGFPAAQNEDGSETWLIHCPAAVAMARDNDPHSGDVEFYIVLGHGPRYLDRNLTVFGRVIDGLEFSQALQRGNPSVNSGVIADEALRDPIISMRVAADLPAEIQPQYEVIRTDGQAFHEAKAARRHRTHEFFFETPPPVIEACQLPIPVRQVETSEPAEAGE